MNNINKKLLQVTKTTFDKTERVIEKTDELISKTNKLHHFSPQTKYKGCKVGLVIGSTLLTSGIIGTLFKQEKWPLGFIIVGSLTIGSNIITMKNIKMK